MAGMDAVVAPGGGDQDRRIGLAGLGRRDRPNRSAGRPIPPACRDRRIRRSSSRRPAAWCSGACRSAGWCRTARRSARDSASACWRSGCRRSIRPPPRCGPGRVTPRRTRSAATAAKSSCASRLPARAARPRASACRTRRRRGCWRSRWCRPAPATACRSPSCSSGSSRDAEAAIAGRDAPAPRRSRRPARSGHRGCARRRSRPPRAASPRARRRRMAGGARFSTAGAGEALDQHAAWRRQRILRHWRAGRRCSRLRSASSGQTSTTPISGRPGSRPDAQPSAAGVRPRTPAAIRRGWR